MRTEIVAPHAALLIESTRAIGYSVETAIADIIDNSLAADAKHVHVRYQLEADNLTNSVLAIMDDGCGMTASVLREAMRYGSKGPLAERDRKDLGRYGLGLKTASLSQCRCLTVVSKVDGIYCACRWDVDCVVATNDWSLQILDEDEIRQVRYFELLDCVSSGTVVIWERLDRMLSVRSRNDDAINKVMADVQDHLALVFHRFMSGNRKGGRVEITLNNRPLKPIDPFLCDKSTQTMAKRTCMVDGHEVTVTPHLLPIQSKLTREEVATLGGFEGLRRSQGFYVYRGGRLVVWGTWFGMARKGELTKNLRIQVDIPNTMDDVWTLDIKKSKATPPESVRTQLAEQLKRLLNESEKQVRYRGHREVGKQAKETVWVRWEDRLGVRYALNREYSVLSQALQKYPQLESCLKLIEASLPLNALYADLTDDKCITNESDMASLDVDALVAMFMDKV